MSLHLHSHDDHPHGLGHDLKAMERLAIGRRRALGLLGLGTGALLTGCGGSDSNASSTSGTVTATPTPSPTPTPTSSSTGTSGSCVSYPTETSGPYPADGTNTSSGATSDVLTQSGIVRSDIRSSFIGSSTVATGVPLTLNFYFQDSNNACAGLQSWAIYLWHCDKDGNYSLYTAPAESYLRGVQVTDSNGLVSFTTIYPACYSGRYPHIHFEAFSSLSNATSGNYARLISQFALPDASNQAVYATSAYSSSKTNYAAVSIASDNVFGDNTSAQIAAQTITMTGDVTSGYTGTATIGIAT